MREKETINGVERFKQNGIVRYLLDTHKDCDLNLIWKLCESGLFSKEDLQEFYELIGYTISGYEEIFGKK